MRKRADDSVAASVRDAVRRSGDRAWSTSDFPDHPAAAVTAALHRLSRQGDLLPIRKGLYWRGHRTSWGGMSRPDNIRLTQSILQSKGVGWAGLSAANALGLTDQVPAVDSIAVPGSKPRSVPGVRFESRTARRARVSARLSEWEVAVLEVLAAWQDVIGVNPGDAIDTIVKYLDDGVVDPHRLARAAADEDGPTRDRLRVVLSNAKRPDLAAGIRPSARRDTTEAALAGIAA